MIDSFLAPERLWLLLLVALLTGVYVAAQRWRGRATVRFTQVELLDAIAPRRPGWRRHAVAAVALAGFGVGVVALARPVDSQLVRIESEGRILLLFDVSSSMAATDIQPDRLAAAQTAAEQFVAQVDDDIEVGLISFSGTVAVDTPPTLDRATLSSAIGSLTLAPSTAIGDALARGTELLTELQADAAGGADVEGTDVAPGAMVLLSDGDTTVGLPTEDGARIAAAAGVPVFTIAFGTVDGTITDPQTGQTLDVPVQPEALSDVAETTGGTAYEAATPAELADAYAQIQDLLTTTLGEQVERADEVTWIWAAVALGLLATGWALSVWWLRGLV